MLTYLIIIFSFIGFLAIGEQLINRKDLLFFGILVIIGLTLFATFRPAGADRDYDTYLYSFGLFLNPADYFKHFSDWAFFDPFYYLIPSFLKTYVSPQYYIILTFFVFAAIAVTLKAWSIYKLSNFFFLSLLVYFSNFFLLHEMTQIRAAVATGFFLTGIYYLEKKKYIVFLCLILLSTSFHYSSLLYLFVLLLNARSFNKPLYFGLLALTLIFAFIDTGFIFSFFSIDLGPLTIRASTHAELSELGLVEKVNKLSILFLSNFIITVVLILFSKTIYNHNKYAYLLIKLQVWGLLFFQLFSAIATIAFRFSELFLCVEIITIPFILFIFKNRLTGLIMVFLIAAGYFWMNLFHEKIFILH
jgi:hypothetical protein